MASARFLAAGAEVVVCSRKRSEELPSAGGRRALVSTADVRDVAQIERVVSLPGSASGDSTYW